MVRRSAVSAVRELYPAGSLEPLRFELASMASDVGKGGVTEILARAHESEEAMALAKQVINAPVSEVRRFGLSQLPQLFESGSLDPWLLALESRYSDIRLNVVDRLVDSTDERVLEALSRAMESEHEDLRLRAAGALASRGDMRTVDVLSGLLFSEEWQDDAGDALVELAHASLGGNSNAAAKAASLALIARVENDPDKTADQYEILTRLERIAHPTAADYLTRSLLDEERENAPDWMFDILVQCLQPGSKAKVYDKSGGLVPQFEDVAFEYAEQLAASKEPGIRRLTITNMLRYLPGRDAEELLELLLDDRDAEIRVHACEALAYRAAHLDGNIGALASALREARRELVLPAAEGLAARQEGQAFQPLMLVYKAGEQHERSRAVIAMGALGDERVLEELLPLIEGANELEPEDAEMVPAAVESLGRMLPHLKAESAERVRALVENLAREGSYELRTRALQGLRQAGDKRSRVFIESIAADRLEGHRIRESAIEELGALANPASESVLADVVREGGDYSTASAALEALRKMFPEEKTRTELLALKSADQYLSAPAASFLSWFGDVETLMQEMGAIEDIDLRKRLRQGLIRRQLSDTKGIEPSLKRMLESDKVADRGDASWIVGAANIRSLADTLSKALDMAPQAYASARSANKAGNEALTLATECWLAGLWSATRLGVDASKAAQSALKNHELPEHLRVQAVEALGDKDKGLLEELLSDVQPGVRAAGAAALARSYPDASRAALDTPLADPAALRPLIQSAAEQGAELLSSESRRIATSTMMGQGKVEEFSRVAKEGEDEAARLAAIAALSRIGGASAEQTLSTLLAEDAVDAVKAASFRALRRLQRRAAKRASYESEGGQ
jgi:ParB family chromosome partitioning protein